MNGKRIYDKCHWCLYCGKAFPKIGRHLQVAHKHEDEIVELGKMERKERMLKLDVLRYRGDFHQNMKVLKTGGELVVWRRPSTGDIVNYRDFLPCTHCLVFVTKLEMWRHLQTCKHKMKTNNNDIIARSKVLLYPNQHVVGASTYLQTFVLDNMNNDEITSCVKQDQLISTYGSFLLGTTTGMKTANSVSQRMRVLARLLLCLRTKLSKPKLTMKEMISPLNFDNIVEATKEIGGFTMVNSEGEFVPSFATPSVPLMLGYALEKCVSLYRGIGIKTSDQKIIKDSVDFLELYKLEWTNKICTLCHKTMDLNRFNKIELLPFTEDLLKVRAYLKSQIPLLRKELVDKPEVESWRKLAEVVGTRLTIFNRRRGNEVYNLLISSQ